VADEDAVPQRFSVSTSCQKKFLTKITDMAYTCPVALSPLTRANKDDWILMLMNWTSIRCTRDEATAAIGQSRAGMPVVQSPILSPGYPFTGGKSLEQIGIAGLAITDRRYKQL
jgi:hypothetical protein